MSRRCIGYEGEGKARRPIYEDQGPANGRGASDSGRAMVARLSDLTTASLSPSAGAAAVVERRMATEAQRAHWRTPAAAESPIAPVAVRRPALDSPEHLQASRMRGAARHVEVITARRPTPAPPPEEPVMDAEPAPAAPEPEDPVDPFATALWAVRDAADEAAEAWSLRIEAEGRWRAAEAALRASVEALAAPVRPDVLAAIDEFVASQSTPLEPPASAADASSESGPEPAEKPVVVAPRRQAREPRGNRDAGLSARQAKAIELLTSGKTRAEAARDMGVSYQTIDGLIEAAAKKGLVPAELYPVLPARFAKYATPAVG